MKQLIIGVVAISSIAVSGIVFVVLSLIFD